MTAEFAIITGSGFYAIEEIQNAEEIYVETPWGAVAATQGTYRGKKVLFISRHQKGHRLLPNMINHRANITACRQMGVRAIISTTVCGILQTEIPLAQPILYNDLFFPDNRLPSGETCTLYTVEGQPERGHLIFANPFYDVSSAFGDEVLKGKTYGHVNGPRFNSKSEIRFLAQHCDAISQTCGPETILANEAEIPYILLGFGVDYANGVSDVPTPLEILDANMADSQTVFKGMIDKIMGINEIDFGNFVYRFE